jgi:hypothetical protein
MYNEVSKKQTQSNKNMQTKPKHSQCRIYLPIPNITFHPMSIYTIPFLHNPPTGSSNPPP